jgi:hypothetical protein
MKTESEVNEGILKLTTTIQAKFPELVKYLNEMPVTFPYTAQPEENLKALNDYYNSLETLMEDYAINHHSTQ